MKTCSYCKNEKPLSEFGFYKKSDDGYRWNCKSCTNTAFILNRYGQLNFDLKGTGKRLCSCCHVIKPDKDFYKGYYICKRCFNGYDLTSVMLNKSYDLLIKIDNRVFHKVTPVMTTKSEIKKFIKSNIPDISYPVRQTGMYEQSDFEILLISPIKKGFNAKLKKLKHKLDDDKGHNYISIKPLVDERREIEKISTNYFKN